MPVLVSGTKHKMPEGKTHNTESASGLYFFEITDLKNKFNTVRKNNISF